MAVSLAWTRSTNLHWRSDPTRSVACGAPVLLSAALRARRACRAGEPGKNLAVIRHEDVTTQGVFFPKLLLG